MLKILVVDDEPDLCSLIADALGDDGHDVTCALDGAQAVAAASVTTFDVVLADVHLPQVDGLTLFRRLREDSPTTDMILMTAAATVSDAVAVLREGAFDYLPKPIRMDELGIQLTRIASYRALQHDVAAARAELAIPASVGARLVGHSPGMLLLGKRIDAIAHSDAAVVITGETGTGKELVARALHEGGERRGKPFVAVNCAAFPDTLIEAELFGHERGAFTGATHRREGRFKAAHGGTLFLDEVAELSQAAQAKLLRVLQERTIEPLGSNQSVQVDVRIISATHRDLKQRIAEGLFREDLYYRINTIDLAIPPLRARSGDLALLVGFFIQRFSKGDATAAAGITWRAWNALSSHQFPGNVRELMHTIEHAALLSKDGPIDLQHLPAAFRPDGTPDRADDGAGAAGAAASSRMAPLGEAMKEFERSYLVRALTGVSGRKAQAAESLGISRKNLWEKLKMHGITDADQAPGPA